MSRGVDRSLPQGWAWARLDQLRDPGAPIVYGIILPGEDIADGVPYLRPIDILVNGTVDFSSVKRTAPAIAAKYSRASIRAGDIVLSIVGTIGKVCVVPAELDGGNITQSSVRIRVVRQVSKAFIRIALLSPPLREQYDRHRFGNAVQRLNVQHARELMVPVPPQKEQDRIVAAVEQHLSDIDAGVAALERLQANLKRYRASVLKAACEGRLVPTEAELARKEKRDYEPADVLLARILKERRARWEADQLAKMKAKGQMPHDDKWKAKYEEPKGPEADEVPDLPEGWTSASVDQVAERIEYGSSAKTSEDELGIPVLRMGNIVDGRLVPDVLKYLPANHHEFPALFLEEGDLLFNRTNSAELVGKTAVYSGYPSPCSFASYLIRVRLVRGCLPTYLAGLINSSAGRAWVASVVTQQVGQANVNGSKLRALRLPLPPLCEQQRIVAELDRLFSVADEVDHVVHAQLGRAARLRQAVLRRAFEGKLVPQDPKDEPASALLDRVRSEQTGKADHATTPTSAPRRRRAVHGAVIERGGNG